MELLSFLEFIDMELIVIIGLITHWCADFILQTDWQAKNKSKNNGALISHTLIYSMCWVTMVPFLIEKVVLFIFITFIFHTITDYYSSRASSYFIRRGDTHNFFVIIGLDQTLHMIQLFLTFVYLSW